MIIGHIHVLAPLLSLLPFFCKADDSDPICPTGYQIVGQKCYMAVSSRSQSEADDYCRENGGGVLAMLKSWDENLAFQKFVGTRNTWLRMNCTRSSAVSCTWPDQSLAIFTDFANGFPNHTIGECVYFIAKSGQWASADCSTLLSFVCELPTTTKDCSGICTYNYNNYCYTPFLGSARSFAQADSQCVALNSHSASIHSFLENRFLAAQFNSERAIWLGGMTPDGYMVLWTDVSEEHYDNAYMAPLGNGTCLAIQLKKGGQGGQWITRDCAIKLNFVCKRPVDSDLC